MFVCLFAFTYIFAVLSWEKRFSYYVSTFYQGVTLHPLVPYFWTFLPFSLLRLYIHMLFLAQNNDFNSRLIYKMLSRPTITKSARSLRHELDKSSGESNDTHPGGERIWGGLKFLVLGYFFFLGGGGGVA